MGAEMQQSTPSIARRADGHRSILAASRYFRARDAGRRLASQHDACRERRAPPRDYYFSHYMPFLADKAAKYSAAVSH